MFKVDYKVLPHKEIHTITFETVADMNDWIKRSDRLGIEIIRKSS